MIQQKVSLFRRKHSNNNFVIASGLQLFIAKDGTAALGNHEVKSQMSTGVQVFKQVVMDDNR